MADLAEGQFELDGVVFGSGTPIRVTSFLPEPQDMSTQDADMPGEDGIRMGRDYLRGTKYAFDGRISTRTPGEMWELWQQLTAAWRAPGTRTTPGAVVPLRMRMPGQPTVRVYGRPRPIAPANLRGSGVGALPFVADFLAADHRVYSDEMRALSITGSAIDYQGTAGTTTPHVPPVTLAEATLPSDVATNHGRAETWPVITLHGPREQPGVSWVGANRLVYLAAVLGDGQSVTVDTRPWARTVLRDDGASLAGALRGSRLADMRLSPGDTQIAFDGRDDTLTSSVDITWRDANPSL